MTFDKWFNNQNKIVQVLLLLIPGVNWVTEVLLRWSLALRTKDTLKIVVAILVTFVGVGFGWLDLIWVLLYGHLILGD